MIANLLIAVTAVLQLGSDWDESSSSVRATYESADFRGLLPAGVACGVIDDAEAPSAEIAAANAPWAKFRMRTVRYPALFLFDDEGRAVLREENLAFDVTPRQLAARIAPAIAARAVATNLFARAAATNGLASAELYGRGFEALDPFMPVGTTRWLVREGDTARGKKSFAAEWAALKACDPKDRSGWQARFTNGDGYADVRRAEMFAKSAQRGPGEEFVRQLRARSRPFWTLEQRQSVDMAEYAFWRRLGENAARQHELLEGVRAAGADTFWGAAARGYLMIEADPDVQHGLKLTSAEAGANVDTNAFRRVLEADPEWYAEFAHSGEVKDREKAFGRLAGLVANCGGEALHAPGFLRRIATATALNCSRRTLGEQVAMVRAYAEIGRRRRLHRAALTQSVYDWRLVVGEGRDAGELLAMSELVHAPRQALMDSHDLTPYNMYNCFGEFSHNPAYYRPWFLAGWKPLQALMRVGGICVGVSQTGVLACSAEGLPAVACAQPGHCAYAVEDAEGKWRIRNPVSSKTVPKFRIGQFAGFSQLDTLTRLYSTERERTLASDRLCAEGKYAEATAAQPLNYLAWRTWWRQLDAGRASEEARRAWADGAAAGLADAREIYWTVLSPYYTALAKRSPAKGAEEIARLYGLFRTDRVKVAEEMDPEPLLQGQARLFDRAPGEMLKVYRAALDAFANDKRGFKAVLKAGDAFATRHPETAGAFQALVREKAQKGFDYSPLIRGASRQGDLAAFRAAVRLQDESAPPKIEGKRYPETWKGGRLLSAEGMLSISSEHMRLNLPGSYARALDTTPRGRSYAAFHTKSETQAWCRVTLPAVAEVTGLHVANSYLKSGRSRAFPLAIEASEDGVNWRTVRELTYEAYGAMEFDVDFTEAPFKARELRLVRRSDGTKRPFSLSKVMVYGNGLDDESANDGSRAEDSPFEPSHMRESHADDKSF